MRRLPADLTTSWPLSWLLWELRVYDVLQTLSSYISLTLLACIVIQLSSPYNFRDWCKKAVKYLYFTRFDPYFSVYWTDLAHLREFSEIDLALFELSCLRTNNIFFVFEISEHCPTQITDPLTFISHCYTRRNILIRPSNFIVWVWIN